MRSKRKKIIISIMIICICILIIPAGYYGWISYKYIQGYSKESKQQFERAKKRLVSYGFSGNLIQKKYEPENYLPYKLIIKLDSCVERPDWGAGFYYDYCFYNFENRTLLLSVSKEIFEKAKLRAQVNKHKMSDSIYIGSKPYLLLNKKPLKWIPE